MKIRYSNDVISPEEVIKFLALSEQSQDIYSAIIRNKEVEKKAKELNIEVNDEDLQKFADNFRTAHGLFSSEQTQNFLKSIGLTEDDFGKFCEISILTSSLMDHMANESKIKDFFINNRSELDLARISTIIVAERSFADEIVMQVTDEDKDFHALAREYSLDESTKYMGGYVGMLPREMLSPEISAKVFNAEAGEVLGPFELGNAFQLIQVEEVKKAELTDDVKQVIKQKIFKEWFSKFIKDGIQVAE